MKEKINVVDLATNAKYPNDNDLCIDDWDTCKCVFRKEKDFDAEKGFVDWEIVIQRYSDNKFFKFTYTQFSNYGDDCKKQIAYEVEEKEKIVKYYE